MIEFEFNYNSGFKWFEYNGVCVKGFGFDNNEQFFSNEKLAQYFDISLTLKEFEEKINTLNGLFSVILIKNDGAEVFIAVDRMRMFPVFYSLKNGDIIISDNVFSIQKKWNSKLSKNKVAGFMSAGFVTSSNTLFDDIFQVEAGTIVSKNRGQIEKKYYYRYSTQDVLQDNSFELHQKASKITTKAFYRLIKSLNNRTAIVPLSGGYDSRLVAVILKNAGYKNVICYTYGRSGNSEYKLAKLVADKLQYKHIFVEYKKELWQNYLNDKTFINYFKYSSNGVSMTFLQEYFAVKYLKDKKLIPDDSVFIPGHSGDFLGGSHLTKYNFSPKMKASVIKQKIYDHYFTYASNIGLTKTDVFPFIAETLVKSNDLSFSVIEDWEMKERMTKCISNSANVYNFFGYEHRLPFWDNELTDFYKHVPYKQKVNKKLYDAVLENDFFAPANLIFEEELQASAMKIKLHQIKLLIKKLLPDFIKKRIAKESIYSYELCMGEITQEMIDDMKKRKIDIIPHYNDSNFTIIQWCISKYLSSE